MACKEKQNPENSNPKEDTAVWWSQNHRTQLGLLGDVKSVTMYYSDSEYTLTEFDALGNITSEKDYTDEGLQSFIEYSYNDKNQLITKNSNDTITQYEYGNHSKFVPTNSLHWEDSQFLKSLSKITCADGSKIVFIASEDEIVAISNNDTTIIKYSGILPISAQYGDSKNGAFVGPVSYQKNGMFLNYTEKTIVNGVATMCKTTYKTDDTFMLVNTYENEEGTTAYTYNDNKCILKTSVNGGAGYEANYYNYEYDNQGNWTSYTMNFSSYPSLTFQYKRKITYYK